MQVPHMLHDSMMDPIGHQLGQTRTRKMTVSNCKLKAIVPMEGKITGHRASTKNVYLTSQISTLAVCHLYRRVRLARNHTEQFHKRSHIDPSLSRKYLRALL